MEDLTTFETPGDYREISIWLDKYDDLFSEFDSSSFKARTLSDNFLTEVRKLVHEAQDAKNIELKFNLMQDEPNVETEALIIKNMHDYFASKAKAAKDEMTSTLRKGGLLSLAGFALITFLILVGHTWSNFILLKGAEMMLDPFGWFLVWNGLDMVFVQSKKEQPTVDFNLKMTSAKLTFMAFGMPVMIEEPVEETEQLLKAS